MLRPVAEVGPSIYRDKLHRVRDTVNVDRATARRYGMIHYPNNQRKISSVI